MKKWVNRYFKGSDGKDEGAVVLPESGTSDDAFEFTPDYEAGTIRVSHGDQSIVLPAPAIEMIRDLWSDPSLHEAAPERSYEFQEMPSSRSVEDMEAVK